MTASPSLPSGAALPSHWSLALAGLQAGVIGGVVTLAYLMIDGLWRGVGPWEFSNLVAAAFYPTMRSLSFRYATVAGWALHVLMCGAAGLLSYPLLARYVHRTRRCRLAGLLVGLGWYYLTFRFFWPSVNAKLVALQPFPGVLFAHILLGICLGLYPFYVRSNGEVKPSEAASPAP